jgi:hypothetical protein
MKSSGQDRIVQWIAGAVLAISLALSGTTATMISSSAGRHKLTFTDQAEKGAPPQVALGIAMGAFRGLFVNFLWIRANDLKQEGKFFEAIELANAITQLQPRFPRVWVFHAWNMAYNISVATQTREERWQWVNAGIRLIRDRGIRANPDDMLLHRELAWIYLHKIQGYTDDANQYYKRRVAQEWQSILGPPPVINPKERDSASVKRVYAEWLNRIVNAPATEDELYTRVPAARDLLTKLRAETGEEPGFSLLRRYEMWRALQKAPQRSIIEARMGPKSLALKRLAEDPAYAEAWSALLSYARRIVLERDYNMQPARMVRYTEQFGPIDWRNPAAHALYWANRGVENSEDRWTELNKRDFDFLNTDRVAVQALQELFRTGEIYFDYLGSDNPTCFYMAVPNAYFTESYGEFLHEVMSRSWADTEKRAWSNYVAGYENFLKDAIRFFYRRGDRDIAERYLERLRTNPQLNLNNPFRAQELADLDIFVQKELEDRYSSPSVAVQEVYGSLLAAYATGLLSGDAELFRANFDYAIKAHRYFFEQQFRKSGVNVTDPRMTVMERNFPVMAGNAFAQFIQILPPTDAETVYAGAPQELQQYAYDILREGFSELYAEAEKTGGRSFAKAFPEPPGMQAHRAEIQRLLDERSRAQPKVEAK